MINAAPQAAVRIEADGVTKYVQRVSEVVDTMKNQLITTYFVTEIRNLDGSKKEDLQPRAEHAG